jgi:hypothetical protein
MKKIITLAFVAVFTALDLPAQDISSGNVPAVVRDAFQKKFPKARKVGWEKEKGNYEANWGGKSGEDHSAQFTPAGNFLEIANSIPVNKLPEKILVYIKNKYGRVKVSEASEITDSNGKLFYEAEVLGKDLRFDETGIFISRD